MKTETDLGASADPETPTVTGALPADVSSAPGTGADMAVVSSPALAMEPFDTLGAVRLLL